MLNKELSAWSLLFGATLAGCLAVVASSGCKPPAPENVDLSTGEYQPEVSNSSNVTGDSSAVESNTTTGSNTAIETPNEEESEEQPEDTGPENSATQTEFSAPEQVLSEGGDWPQWGGTREKNNVPGVKTPPPNGILESLIAELVSGITLKQSTSTGMEISEVKPTVIL